MTKQEDLRDLEDLISRWRKVDLAENREPDGPIIIALLLLKEQLLADIVIKDLT